MKPLVVFRWSLVAWVLIFSFFIGTSALAQTAPPITPVTSGGSTSEGAGAVSPPTTPTPPITSATALESDWCVNSWTDSNPSGEPKTTVRAETREEAIEKARGIVPNPTDVKNKKCEEAFPGGTTQETIPAGMIGSLFSKDKIEAASEGGGNLLTLAENVLAVVVRGILLFAGFYAIYYLIYSGMLYITSGGEAEKATKGKLGLIYSIVGIVIIALSWIILTYLTQVAAPLLPTGTFVPGQTPL